MATAIAEQVPLTDLEAFQLSVSVGGPSGKVTIVDLLDNLAWFKSAPDWSAWRAFLCAAYGLPMTEEELGIYRRCTGRVNPPIEQAREVWMICGRRARKSAIAGLMAAWAGLKDYSRYLAPGERPWIPVLAKNKGDAQQIKRFATSILQSLNLCPVDPTTEEIALPNTDVVIRAATITAGRSRACPFAALDEVAFFHTDDAAEPDRAIIQGIRPGMATIPGAMLVGLSSPYAKRGALYEAYREHYGKEGPVLVWQADTLTMHDSPQVRAEVQAEYAKDPENAKAEYGAQFRTDVVAYISDELLDACTQPGVTRVEPRRADDIRAGKVKPVTYLAFVDVSGGNQDSFALAIAHWDPEKGKAVLDLAQDWPAPFNPADIHREAASVLRAYGVTWVKGDKYAGEYPRERFAEHKIAYRVTDDVKHDIYRDVIPAFTSRSVELLDLKKLRAQYLSLTRRATSAGKDVIEHPPMGHDDLANAVSGAILEAYRVGKHMKAQVPAKPAPRSLEEMRSRQHQEAWEKLFEREEEVPTVGGMW